MCSSYLLQHFDAMGQIRSLSLQRLDLEVHGFDGALVILLLLFLALTIPLIRTPACRRPRVTQARSLRGCNVRKGLSAPYLINRAPVLLCLAFKPALWASCLLCGTWPRLLLVMIR